MIYWFSLTSLFEVIATFEGTLRSAMGNAILDGTLHPPGKSRPFLHLNFRFCTAPKNKPIINKSITLAFSVYSPEMVPEIPWRKEQDGMGEDNNHTEIEETHTTNTPKSETQSTDARQTTLKMLTTEPPVCVIFG